MLSRAVSVGSRLYFWKTNPTVVLRSSVRSASLNPSRSCPASRMLPALGGVNPPMIWNSVDFPEPDGPTIDTNSPAPTSKFTPRSACTSTSPARYVFRKSRMEMIGASLIRKRLDGILTCGLQSRIDRAQNRAHQRDPRRNRPPDVYDRLDQRSVNHIGECEPRHIGQQDSQYGPTHGHHRALAKQNVQYVARRRAQRLQYPDLARALQHCRIHGEKHHQKSHQHSQRDHHPDKLLQHGNVVHRIELRIVRHGPNLVTLELLLQRRDHLIGPRRIVQLHVDDRDLAGAGGQILQFIEPHD